MKQREISMSGADLGDAELTAVIDVLRTGRLSLGPHLEAFEEAIAAYAGTRFAVGVNSGTSGLHLCVIAAGVKEADLVVTTPFSFVASSNCIVYERAVPIFVDVDPKTGNIDPALVAECVGDLVNGKRGASRWLPRRGVVRKRLRRARALLPVHAFGQPADMDPLTRIAREYDLRVIEDACEALGSEYKNSGARTFGDAAVFAFYPNKQITTGEGGIIVTSRSDWNVLFRSLRNQGRDCSDSWLRHVRLGYNYRLDEMSAALGRAQLARIDELLPKRRQVALWYKERLADLEAIELPYIAPTTTRMSWFVYVIRVKPPVGRDAVMKRLAESGVPSRAYFTPIHLQKHFRDTYGYKRGDFPVTERLADTSLALPFSGVMTEDEVDDVCDHLRRIVGILA